MTSQEFDKEFQQLCTGIIENVYKFVDHNVIINYHLNSILHIRNDRNKTTLH